ncbi:MAG: ABC transporter permease [Ignavibacteriaceae bacterium]|nr:ABC transporter permease [Ignavibacteriaceae bacterium]
MNKEFFLILLKRLLTSIVVLFLMITFIFILLRLSPGNPVNKFISPELSPEIIEKIKADFDLNDTILNQYLSFLTNLMSGELGISYNYREPVLKLIMQFLPFTIIFTLISFTLQVAVSGILAALSVKKLNGVLDSALIKFNLIIFSLPSFVIGVFLILIFSDVLELLPSSGLRSYDFDSKSFIQKVLDYASHLIMPVMTLAIGGIAVFYRYLRDGFEETINKLFILNLKANGFSDKTIMLKHIIPNALGPFIAAAGVELGILLGGALITEVIFSLPGMGRLTINAIMQRDYPLIIGCSLTAGTMVILSNLFADLVRAKLDKRLTKDIIN